jgi:hypothetical protein
MSNISSLCDEIMKRLTALGRMTASSMLPGLPETKIRQLTAGLPCMLPHSVIELYRWSEGLRPQSGIGNEFLPGFGMDSLPEMIGLYNELSNAPEFPRFRCGDMRWFPIFRSGGTDFYGVRCSHVATVDGEVIFDDNEGEHRDCVKPPPVEFISLEAMLQTLLSAYETGVYYVDENGRLTVGSKTFFDDGPLKGNLMDIDLSRFNEVARHFNPGLDCWK